MLVHAKKNVLLACSQRPFDTPIYRYCNVITLFMDFRDGLKPEDADYFVFFSYYKIRVNHFLKLRQPIIHFLLVR